MLNILLKSLIVWWRDHRNDETNQVSEDWHWKFHRPHPLTDCSMLIRHRPNDARLVGGWVMMTPLA